MRDSAPYNPVPLGAGLHPEGRLVDDLRFFHVTLSGVSAVPCAVTLSDLVSDGLRHHDVDMGALRRAVRRRVPHASDRCDQTVSFSQRRLKVASNKPELIFDLPEPLGHVG